MHTWIQCIFSQRSRQDTWLPYDGSSVPTRWDPTEEGLLLAGMRSTLKRHAEAMLSNDVSMRLAIRWNSPVSLVLAVHNVLPEGESPRGDRSLHLPFSTFCEILDWLSEEFEFGSLAMLCGGSDASTARPRVLVTFDDA